uniref:Uncharacterized protein n=1 Tax=Dulem virus 42 TaxID=3145760 RepID=A0AAU8BA09_9CAUD
MYKTFLSHIYLYDNHINLLYIKDHYVLIQDVLLTILIYFCPIVI